MEARFDAGLNLTSLKWTALETADHVAAHVCTLQKQLDSYFDGTQAEFDFPLKPTGTTFQQDVWRSVCGVAFGETTTYGALATAIGSPRGARAVGLANARNPVAILIPCHRLVGSSGELRGYAGGLDRKRALLNHEAMSSHTRGR